MLYDMEKMADEAAIHVLVMSRPLTAREQREVIAIVNAWLLLWSVSNRCPASRCESLFQGQILFWAVDLRPREQRGVSGGLTGSELDLLFGPLETFGADLRHSVSIEFGEAIIIDGRAIRAGQEWRNLRQQGRLTAETLIVRPGPVSTWRNGHLVHSLGDDEEWAPLLLGK